MLQKPQQSEPIKRSFNLIPRQSPPPFQFSKKMPEPLPSTPVRPLWSKILLPAVIGLTAVGVIFSGAYLFIQGQALTKKTKTTQQKITQNSNQDILPTPPIARISTSDDVTDSIKTQAMAAPQKNQPIKIESKTVPSAVKPLIIQIRDEFAHLREGPGTHFPILDKALYGQKFFVSDFDKNWFQIRPVIKSSNTIHSIKSAWIRNDLVEPIEPDTIE